MLPHLVESLLDMSRLRAGALGVHPQPAGVAEVIPLAVDEFGSPADDVQIQLADVPGKHATGHRRDAVEYYGRTPPRHGACARPGGRPLDRPGPSGPTNGLVSAASPIRNPPPRRQFW